MSKNELIRNLRNLSSGTIATIINCAKYSVIDRAASKAVIYASELTEDECKSIITFEDICNLFKAANNRKE